MVFTGQNFRLPLPPGWTLRMKKRNGSYVLAGITEERKEFIQQNIIRYKLEETFHVPGMNMDNDFLSNHGYDIEVWFKNGETLERDFNINEIILSDIYYYLTSTIPNYNDPNLQNLPRLWNPHYEWP